MSPAAEPLVHRHLSYKETCVETQVVSPCLPKTSSDSLHYQGGATQKRTDVPRPAGRVGWGVSRNTKVRRRKAKKENKRFREKEKYTQRVCYRSSMGHFIAKSQKVIVVVSGQYNDVECMMHKM